MNNSARREFDDEEGVDLPEEQGENREKVTGPDHLGVILEEGWPILTMGGVGACQADVLLDRRPCDLDAEFHDFATDALRAPEAILPAICWIKAMVSQATLGRPPRLWDWTSRTAGSLGDASAGAYRA